MPSSRPHSSGPDGRRPPRRGSRSRRAAPPGARPSERASPERASPERASPERASPERASRELSVDEILAELAKPPARDDPQDHHRLGLAHQLRRRGGPSVVAVVGRLRKLLTAAARVGPLEKVLVQTLASLDHADGDAAVADVLLGQDRRWDRLRGADWVRLLEPMLARGIRAEQFFVRAAGRLSDPRRAVPILVAANAAAERAVASPHPLAGQTAALLALLDADEPDAPTLAAHTLGRVGDPASFTRLRTLLAEPSRDRSGDPWLRAEAALALARAGDELGLTALRQAAATPPTDQWARQQLEALGRPMATLLTLEPSEDLRARVALQRLLDSPTGDSLSGSADRLQIGRRRELILTPWPKQDGLVECRLWELSATDGGGQSSSQMGASWGLTGPAVRVREEETRGLSAEDALSLYCGEALEQLDAVRELSEPSDPAEWEVLDATAAKLIGEPPRLLRSVIVGGQQKLRAYWARRGGSASDNTVGVPSVGVLIVGEGPPAWLRQPPSDSPNAVSQAALLRRALWVYIGQHWRAAQARPTREP